MLTRLQFGIERLGAWWCRMHHQTVRWPLHGEYECGTCYRRYPVPWSEPLKQHATPGIYKVSHDHDSVTTWTPPRHDLQHGYAYSEHVE